MGKSFRDTVWDFAAGPDVEEIGAVEVPNSYQRYQDFKKLGMNDEQAGREAVSEFERISELNKVIVKPVNKGFQTVNRNVKRNTIISWGALVGHPVSWGISGLRHKVDGEGVVKAVASGAQALKMAVSGKPE